MLSITLDNVLAENKKSKTFAILTTKCGEVIKIYHRDSKYKSNKVRIGIDCSKDVIINRGELGDKKYTPYEKCTAVCKWSKDKEWFNSDMFHGIAYSNRHTLKLSHGQSDAVNSVVERFSIEVGAWL